jgi:hypothetical protein
MVHMLSANGWIYALAMRGLLHDLVVLEPALVFSEGSLGVIMITVIKFSVLHGANVGSVFLGQNLLVLNRLDGAMVVVLMNLLVDGGVDLLVLVRLDCFVLYGWGYFLVDSSVMVAGIGSEIFD